MVSINPFLNIGGSEEPQQPQIPQGQTFNPFIQQPGGNIQQPAWMGQQFGGMQQPAWMSGFQDYYDQLAQANQQIYEDQRSAFQKEERPVSRRKMNAIEQFGAGANQLTEDLGVGLGDVLGMERFDVNKGLTPENVASFAVNLPGMFVGAVPDALATGVEILTGSPVKEVERGSDEIDDRQLTLQERAADVGYLGATVASMFIGPEARLAGLGAKAVSGGAKAIGRKGLGTAIDNAADLAVRGAVKKAAPFETAIINNGGSAGAIKAAKIGDTILETGASAAVEGAEEAVQTGFEDIRFHQIDDGKTLDRMAQAGMWGALGGGLLGGVVGTATTASDIAKMKTQSDSLTVAANDENAGGMHSAEPYRWQQLRQENTSGEYLPTMRRYYDEQAKSDNRLRADGSVTVTLSESNPNYNTNDFGVGVLDYADAFSQNENAAAEMAREMTRGKLPSANAVAEMNLAIRNLTVSDGTTTTMYGSLDEALNALKQKYWGKNRGPRIALEKRPGAHYTGGYGELVEFKPGRGLACATHVSKIIGADHDSDTGTLHFVTRTSKGGNKLNLLGYMSDMIVSPENVPLTDFYYTNFNERFNGALWRKELDRVFDRFNAKKSVEDKNGSHEVSYRNYYKKAMQRALNSNDDVRAAEIAGVLRELNEDIKDLYKRAKADPSLLAEGESLDKMPNARNAFQRLLQVDSKNMLKDLEDQDKAMKIKDYEATIGNMIQQDDEIPEETRKKFVVDSTGTLYLRGTIGGNERVSSIMEEIGLALYTLVTSANQPFRQHGQLNLNFAKRQGAYTDFVDRLHKLNLDTDVIDTLVRCAFRIARTGTTPLQAIEGLINQRTIDETFRRAGLDTGKISSAAEFDTVLGIFAEEYDKGNADYEYAQMIPTANGWKKNPAASKRNDISKASRQEKEGKFLEVMGGVAFDDIFDPSVVPSDFHGYPLSTVISEYASHPSRFSRIFANVQDAGLQNVIDNMIKAKNAEKPNISRSIKAAFKNIEGLGKIKGRMREDEHGVRRIDRNDYAAIVSYVNNFVDLLTPKMVERLGITDPIKFVEETKVGQLLVHEDAQIRINTWFAMLTRAKFGDLHDLIHNVYDFDEAEAKLAKENAMIELTRLADRPGIQGLIAKEMLANNGDSTLYDIFTSLEGGFDGKESQFNQAYNPPGNWDLIVDMMMDSDDEFAISSVSKRYRESQQSLAQYEKALIEESRESIRNIASSVERGILDERVVEAAIDTSVKSARLDVNLDSAVLAVYNSLGSGLSQTEKGVNEAAASSFFEAMEIVENGNPLSLIERVTACKSGVISLENWGTNKKLLLMFLDGQFDDGIRVYNNQCRTKIMTRDWLFSELNENYDPEIGPQYADWMALFDKCPQIEAYIADSVTQPIVVNGEGDATVAKAGTLYDSCMSYNAMVTGSDEGPISSLALFQIDYAIHEVELELLSDGRYISNMVWCMQDMGLPENASIDAIRKQFVSLHRQFARAHFFHAQKRSNDFNGSNIDSGYSATTSSYFKDIDQRFFSEVVDTFETLAETMRQSEIESEASKIAMQQAIEENNRATLYRETLQTIFNECGYVDDDGSALSVHSVATSETIPEATASEARITLEKAKIKADYILAKIKEIYTRTVERPSIDSVPLELILVERDQLSGVDKNTMGRYRARLYRDAWEAKNRGKAPGERVPLTPVEQRNIEEAIVGSYSAYVESQNTPNTDKIFRDQESSMSDDELDDFLGEIPEIPYLDRSDVPVQYTEKRATELLSTINDIKVKMGSPSAVDEYLTLSDIRDMYDDNGRLIKGAADKLVKRINGYVIDMALRSVNRELNAEYNTNAVLAESRYEEAFYEMQDAVFNRLSETPNPLDRSGENKSLLFTNRAAIERASKHERFDKGFPVPDFTKKSNQNSNTNITLAIAGGPVPGSITRNGGSLKSSYSVSFLPNNRVGTIEPKEMSIEKLRKEVAKDPAARQWKYLKGGTWSPDPSKTEEWSIGTVGGLLSNIDPEIDSVLVFDPEDNPHGIWATNTPAPLNQLNRETLRLGSILGAIIDGSQEPLVLKLKKRFEERKRVAEANGFKTRKPGSVDLSGVSDVEAIRTSLVEALKKYRRGYTKEFTEAFESGELKPIGFGSGQSLIIAQGLTPGMVCRINGDEVSISAETLFNPEKFQAFYQSKLGQQDAALSFGVCDVLSVSPTEAHNLIIDATKRYNQKCRREGIKPTKNGEEQAAYEAFTTGWDSYFDNPLSIDEVLGAIRPMGWGHNSMLTPEETPTTYARYLDRITGGKSGSVVKSGKWRTGGKLLTKGSNEALYEATTRATNFAFGKKSDYRLLRVFISEDAERLSAIDGTEPFKGIRDLSGSDVDYYSQDKNGDNNGVGYVEDASKIHDALDWACHNGNMLVVSRKIFFDNRSLFANRKGEIEEVEMFPDSDDPEICYLITPAVDNLMKNGRSEKTEISTKAFDPNSIEGILLDKRHRYRVGDASIYADETFAQGLEATASSKAVPQELTGGALGKVEVVNRKEAKILRDKLFVDDVPESDEVWSENRFSFASKRFSEENSTNIKYAIKEFLDEIIDGNDVSDDGFRRVNAGSGKVLGLIKVTDLGGNSVIAPFMAPNNSPKHYDQCLIKIDRNGTIFLNYSSNLETMGNSGDNKWFKMSIPDMVFKGMVIIAPEGVDLPTFRGPMANQEEKVKLLTSWDTAKSRLGGRHVETMVSDMMYFAKKYGFSYLYDTNGQVKQHISDQYKDDRSGLIDLLKGGTTQWMRVGWGDIKLAEDEVTNEFIAAMVRANIGRADLPKFFSPGWDFESARTKSNIRFFAFFNDVNEDLVLRFFHGMDERICPNGLVDETPAEKFFFNKDGEFKLFDNGYVYWDYVKWSPPEGIGAFSELHGKASKSGESNQAMIRLAMDTGYLGRDLQTAMDYASAQAGDPSFYHDQMIEKMTKAREEKVFASQPNRSDLTTAEKYYWSPGEIRFEQEIASMDAGLDPRNGRTVYHRGKEVENPFSNNIPDNPMIPAVASLQALASDGMLSHEVISGLSVYQTGHTYNDGKGSNSITLTHLASSISTIKKNIEETGLPIVYTDVYDIDHGRVPMPLLNRVYARILWDHVPAIRNHPDNRTDDLPDFDKFVERMKEEQGKTDAFLATMTQPQYTSKRQELRKWSEWCWREWGEIGKSGLVYSGYYASDIINNTNIFCANAYKDVIDVDALSELAEQNGKLQADTRRANDKRRFGRQAPDPNSAGRSLTGYPLDYSKPFHWFLRRAVDTTSMMGVFDFWIPVSNLGFRGVAQTMMDAVMRAGNKIMLSDVQVNQDILRNVAARDLATQSTWSLMRDEAVLDNQEELFEFLQNGGSVEDYINNKAKGKRFDRVKNTVFKIASGGDALMGQQFTNFVNRFTYYAAEIPALRQYWLEKGPNGFSHLDEVLAEPGGGQRFLIEVFAGSEGSNPSLLAARQALESCRLADMAQKHIFIEMFKNITNNHPLPEFLMRTMVSRFPGYGLNITEEVLNFILPMCSIRQAFITFMAERGHEKAARSEEAGGTYVDPHYEKLLRNTNMREALLVDMLHYGAAAVAMILAAIPGAVEPPDDENKWGNYHEWLLLGSRVGEAWWMEDILGIAGPACCFQKSIDLGKPRLDLLVNGVANVCYNNPMLKISDVVEFMVDPMGNIEDDYELAKQKYAQAPGGEPSLMDFLQAKATTFGLSWASQFITPTFVKSLTNWATPYELDYKNVYTENTRGVLTDSGKAGENLTRTTYEDAMIRRLTRRNPVLALIMDLTRPGNTSYSGINAIAGLSGKMPMPYTRYLDQYQYSSMKSWSIEGMSNEDAQAKVAQIMILLMEYQDNLDALVSTGFYLDTVTKAAVSSTIWDTYYQVDKEWIEFRSDASRSDYLVLGEGDWDLGKERYGEIQQYYKNAKREINNFYYKTMKSKQLSMPMAEYRRYNTTYAQDDNGEWYATGFHPQGVLPFIGAPGTITNPEGTAGYDNDFVTLSQVTGLPLENMRALVPFNDNDTVDWPGLKEWSDDQAGNGYSKLYQSWYGTDAGTVGSSTTRSTSSYPRSSGGYGGGSRGGGGGGGGGGYSRGGSSAPNAYAPSVSLPRANVGRIMSVDRTIKPDYEYLRPDFETKGSREAYRRSDI